MAVDMFLKIDGVKGESFDDKHKEEIDILAFSWGASNAGNSGTGGGGGAGKVAVRDFSITKYTDKSSPDLFLACANGKHYKTADFVVRKAGEKPLEYLKIKFSDLLVTDVGFGGAGGGEDRLTENISLNFAKVEIEYFGQKADGTAEGAVKAMWNIKANA